LSPSLALEEPEDILKASVNWPAEAIRYFLKRLDRSLLEPVVRWIGRSFWILSRMIIGFLCMDSEDFF